MQKTETPGRKKNYSKFITFILILAGVAGLLLYQKNARPEKKFGASFVSALSENEDNGKFARAAKIRKFSFPADSGPHPDFQTEWWYYTGNLTDKAQNRYGFQLTFFRRGLSPVPEKRTSGWGTNQIYFAHFTVSDIKNKKFYFSERFSRGGAGLAGAKPEPYHVWLENWDARQEGDSVSLKAENRPVSIDLKVKSLKPVALQGEKGLSRKSRDNASYYYSESRLDTKGTIKIGTESFAVTGLSWLDREWSTSGLSKEQTGWDWFSLQFADNREIMLYQLRLKDGGTDPFSSGSLIEKDGRVIPLKKEDFNIKVLGYWKSPATKIVYPAKWRIAIPKYDLELTITPHQPDQELGTSFVYWEGAVQVTGKNINGNGYVELTGYNE
jgi:predicted secreted hydrolase